MFFTIKFYLYKHIIRQRIKIKLNSDIHVTDRPDHRLVRKSQHVYVELSICNCFGKNKTISVTSIR